MGFFSSVKKAGSKIVDVRVDRWIGVSELRHTTNQLITYAVDNLSVKKANRIETFDEAMERLNLEEKNIAQKLNEFKLLCGIFILMAIAVFSYAVYMATVGFYMACLISLSLTAYMLAMAFRFHFWAFQIKNRKLGCTFQEWLDSKVTDKH